MVSVICAFDSYNSYIKHIRTFDWHWTLRLEEWNFYHSKGMLCNETASFETPRRVSTWLRHILRNQNKTLKSAWYRLATFMFHIQLLGGATTRSIEIISGTFQMWPPLQNHLCKILRWSIEGLKSCNWSMLRASYGKRRGFYRIGCTTALPCDYASSPGVTVSNREIFVNHSFHHSAKSCRVLEGVQTVLTSAT